MATTGHENEAVNVFGLKANERKLVNLLPYNEGTCSTAANTAAKAVTVSGNSFSLVNKAKVIVTFSNGISVDNATLSVNSGTAKAIYYKGAALKGGLVAAGEKLILEYNGTQWEIIGNIVNDNSEELKEEISVLKNALSYLSVAAGVWTEPAIWDNQLLWPYGNLWPSN